MRTAWLTLALLAGCDPLIQDGTLIIDKIELGNVDADTVLAPGLEVEVALYESTSGSLGRYLGCAGPDSGLDNVTSGNAKYSVNAYFKPSGGTGTLKEEDLTASEFIFVVSEDDHNSCPTEQDATKQNQDPLDDQDDLIQQLPAITKADFLAGKSFGSGAVIELSVGKFPSKGRAE